jgi:hypothetical protein
MPVSSTGKGGGSGRELTGAGSKMPLTSRFLILSDRGIDASSTAVILAILFPRSVMILFPFLRFLR